MKKIIVAVDFSPVSENAALYAAELSISIKAEVILFHAYEPPLLMVDTPIPAPVFTDMAVIARQSMNVLADKVSSHIKSKRRIHTEIQTGSLSGCLRISCQAHKPHLVVMGSSGVSTPGRFFFGSQVLAVLQRLEYPVLVIPPRALFAGIHNLALATDMETDELIGQAGIIKELMQGSHTRFFAINVIPGQTQPEHRNGKEKKLNSIFRDFKPEFHYLHSEKFEEGIDKFCDDFNIDMLVMIPHRHAFFNRLLHTTHSASMLKQPILPILFWRSDK